METKVCRKCGIKKPITDYYLDKGKPRNICKVCHCSETNARKIALGITKNPTEKLEAKREGYKVCRICKEEKPLALFARNISNKDGYRNECKLCSSHNYKKEHDLWYKDKEKRKAQMKAYRKAHPEIQKAYVERNRERIREKSKEYWLKKGPEILAKRTKEDVARWNRTRYRRHKLQRIVLSGLQRGFKDKKNYDLGSILPYTIEELKAHLESQFQPGMTWENHGLHGWHIDHIKPVCTFDFLDGDLSNPEVVKVVQQCWALSNLRPLWAKDNLSRPKDGNDTLIPS